MTSSALREAAHGPSPSARRIEFFSPNPSKRAVERYWLWYTPVWGALAGGVMLSGWAEEWGDGPLLAQGVLLALGAVLGPHWFCAPEDRGRPLRELSSVKLSLSVVGFAFLMNYFCTPFFFDVLHMHYGFQTQLNIQNVPLFLYFMTVAYFATYAALVMIGYRVVRSALAGRSRWLVGLGAALVPFVVAGFETAMNANPFMSRLFCYDDMGFMMWFGTLCYGTCFVFCLPVWMSIDELPGRVTAYTQLAVGVLAAMMMIVISFELYRHLLAPHVTTVIPGANGLRDVATSCLEAL